MSPTEYEFQHSLVVMSQLARDAAKTPPRGNGPPFEYVDRSLTILARKFDTNDRRMRQEHLSQREFIASQFRDVEKKMDGRFQEFEKKMDGRFQKVDRRFQEVDRRFQEMDKKIDGLGEEMRNFTVQLENTAAFTKNDRLRRMHQSVNLIKVLKPTSDPCKFVWASHPQVPGNMKGAYILGQRAKGEFEPGWEGKSNEQKARAQEKALDTISELANFYNIVIWSEEESESDATELMLEDWSVDEYMEALLAEWGMDWQKVLRLGMQHMQDRSQLAGAKRAGDTGSGGETKKTRGREGQAV